MESSSLVTVRSLTMVNVQQAGSPKQLPEGKTSIFWAIFLVVNAALGAGLLAFPLSFYMTGGIIQGIMIELVRPDVSIGYLNVGFDVVNCTCMKRRSIRGYLLFSIRF